MRINRAKCDNIVAIEMTELELRLLATACARLSGGPNPTARVAVEQMREVFAEDMAWPLQSAYLLPSGLIGVPIGVDLTEQFDDEFDPTAFKQALDKADAVDVESLRLDEE